LPSLLNELLSVRLSGRTPQKVISLVRHVVSAVIRLLDKPEIVAALQGPSVHELGDFRILIQCLEELDGRAREDADLGALFLVFFGVGGLRSTRQVLVLVGQLEEDVKIAEPGAGTQIRDHEQLPRLDDLHLVVVDEEQGVEPLSHLKDRLIVIVDLTV